MTRILVVDDHAVVRQGLKQIVAETTDIVVAAEASNGQEVLDMVLESDYDLVLLDISMPGGSGLEVLKQLKNLRPEVPVLILSVHPEEQYAVRALRAGASGYINKDSAPEELIAAIRKVVNGSRYVNPSFAEKLAFSLINHAVKPLHETLSDREYQVMRLIASGKRAIDIAQELSLSVKTISTYRQRILEKMALKNDAELIRYAIQNSLVEYDFSERGFPSQTSDGKASSKG